MPPTMNSSHWEGYVSVISGVSVVGTVLKPSNMPYIAELPNSIGGGGLNVKEIACEHF